MPITIPAKSTLDIHLKLTTGQTGRYSQQIHMYLDVNNQLIEHVLQIEGHAVAPQPPESYEQVKNNFRK